MSRPEPVENSYYGYIGQILSFIEKADSSNTV